MAPFTSGENRYDQRAWPAVFRPINENHLYDGFIATSNPEDRIDAHFELDLPAGIYYVMVDGVGARSVADGYSDYGSLGQYTISGTIAGTGDLAEAVRVQRRPQQLARQNSHTRRPRPGDMTSRAA